MWSFTGIPVKFNLFSVTTDQNEAQHYQVIGTTLLIILVKIPQNYEVKYCLELADAMLYTFQMSAIDAQQNKRSCVSGLKRFTVLPIIVRIS